MVTGSVVAVDPLVVELTIGVFLSGFAAGDEVAGVVDADASSGVCGAAVGLEGSISTRRA